MQIIKLDELIKSGKINNKRVLMRVDFNVPIDPRADAHGSFMRSLRIFIFCGYYFASSYTRETSMY